MRWASISEAARERDRGVEQVTANGAAWVRKALALLKSYPEREATGEDIRLWLEKVIGPPHHANVVGGFIITAVRQGRLEKTGEYRQMRRKESHARVNPVYTIKR